MMEIFLGTTDYGLRTVVAALLCCARPKSVVRSPQKLLTLNS